LGKQVLLPPMITKQNIGSATGFSFSQCGRSKLLLALVLFVFAGFSSGFSNNYSLFAGGLAAFDAYSLGDNLGSDHPSADSFALIEVLEVREVLEETEHEIDVTPLCTHQRNIPATKVESSFVELYLLSHQQKTKLYVLFQCWKHFLS
jgi:hypothetical protein